jgi:hypothetical protein
MIGLRRALFGLVVTAAYWYCALRLLFRAFPIFVDGSGTEVSFYWGAREPSAYPEIGYAYFVAASIFTLLGCGTVWLVRIRRRGLLQTFLVSWAITFFVFCSAVAVSDAGTKYHIWRGPTALGTARFYQAFLAVIVPLSLVAGLLALARNREGEHRVT